MELAFVTAVNLNTFSCLTPKNIICSAQIAQPSYLLNHHSVGFISPSVFLRKHQTHITTQKPKHATH